MKLDFEILGDAGDYEAYIFYYERERTECIYNRDSRDRLEVFLSEALEGIAKAWDAHVARYGPDNLHLLENCEIIVYNNLDCDICAVVATLRPHNRPTSQISLRKVNLDDPPQPYRGR